MFRDGAVIRAYNIATGGVPVTLMVLDAPDYYVSANAADANAVYFAVSKKNSFDAGRVIRVTGNLTADVLATEGISILEIFVSPTRVIYGAGSPGYPWDGEPYDYRSVPKSGGMPITLVSDPANVIGGAVLAGENVWVGALTHESAPVKNWVNVVRSDGQDFQRLAHARIVGVSHTNPMPLLPARLTVDSITIAHDMSASTAAYPTAMLRSYEGATRAELFVYGSLQTAFLSVFPTENPQSGLPNLLSAQGAPSGGSAAPLDVYFYQSNAPGLTRVTNFAP